MSPAAAYRHFRDRGALLLAVAHQSAGLLADSIDAAISAVARTSDPAADARARLRAGCDGYLDFATGDPGLYRAVFFSDEQVDELTNPTERARGAAGDGGYNLLVAALEDVVAHDVEGVLNPWDPVAVWSTCHGLALLRLDAALRSLSAEQFAEARDRVLSTIVAAIPLESAGRA